MISIDDFDLEPGTVYSAAELRDIFDRQYKKGIETCYDDNGEKYLRVFSDPESDYDDDLNSDPMRYVGQDYPSDEYGNQQPKDGNKALIDAETDPVPIYLFDKPDPASTDKLFIGQVKVLDHDYPKRPEKGYRVFDFYLETIGDTLSSTEVEIEGQQDELHPGTPRPVSPAVPSPASGEERIEYDSEKDRQQEASQSHAETLERFTEELETLGFNCVETEFSDIRATRDEHVLICEVKSLGEYNQRQQIRYALGQLLEYSFRDVVRSGLGNMDTSLYLVFSKPPSDEYSGFLDYLLSRGFHAVWYTDSELQGLDESVSQLQD